MQHVVSSDKPTSAFIVVVAGLKMPHLIDRCSEPASHLTYPVRTIGCTECNNFRVVLVTNSVYHDDFVSRAISLKKWPSSR